MIFSLYLQRRRKGGRRFYADATTKSLLGHRAPSDFAEEKVDDGFMPMPPLKVCWGIEPHQTLPKKKADSGFVRYFPFCQVFQEATAESDKVFSTMLTMLTSNSV